MLLSGAGLTPMRGEARLVAEALARLGAYEPAPEEAAATLLAIRAHGGTAPPMRDASPEEIAAVAEGLGGSGLSPTAGEVRLLASRFGGVPPAAGLALALVQMRRPAYRARLQKVAQEPPLLPLRAADFDAALDDVANPDPTDDALRARLRGALLRRLGASLDPEAAFRLASEDLAQITGRGEPALEVVSACASLAAEAFGMAAPQAAAFVERITDLERIRRHEVREAARLAREARVEADRQQKIWEASLVGQEALPGLLGSTKAEVELWLRHKRLPVARRVPAKVDGRPVERPEFDPVVMGAMRAEVATWKRAVPGRVPAEARPTAPAAPSAEPGAGVRNSALARVAAMDRFVMHFTTARALSRRITLITGPTNSGKSHEALNRLARAESGVALAPLRLLAHEFREALAARGVHASLVTGEERDLVPQTRFTAATVEMCPFHTPVDVAVIDEAQLLADTDRGAAWTAAIMGVPAREVVVLGSPDCVPLVRRIAELCDEPVEEITLERKSPLRAAVEPVALADLKKGDALIAFSRRDVLELRTELQRRNRRVACVYGALSPEVRRAEARRFRETGEADILIATDAIGLGLNLPIERVIFSALEKWDGQARRHLSAPEIRQIGGRAGRYGHHEDGVVAVLVGAGRPAAIALALGAQPAPPDDLRPWVAPDLDIVQAVAAEMGTTSLYATLNRMQRAVLRPDDPSYRLADITAQITIAAEIDSLALPLATRWTYALCPVDDRDHGVERLTRWAVDHAGGRSVRPPEAGHLPAPETAGNADLERAEKTHKRLVAWRWLSLRFPDTYVQAPRAAAESTRVNDWIESVLAMHPRGQQAERVSRRPGPGGRPTGKAGPKPGPKPGPGAGRAKAAPGR